MQIRKKTNSLIVHHSLSGEVSVDDIREWHIERGFIDIGYHFVIHADGKIEHGRHLHQTGAHAKGRNSDSVGVCLVGNFKEHQPTLFQYFALARLHRSLKVIYCKDIALEYHHEECPAQLFDRTFFEGLL